MWFSIVMLVYQRVVVFPIVFFLVGSRNPKTPCFEITSNMFFGTRNGGSDSGVCFPNSSLFLSKEQYLSHQHQSFPNTYQPSITPCLFILFPFDYPQLIAIFHACMYVCMYVGRQVGMIYQTFPTIIGLTTGDIHRNDLKQSFKNTNGCKDLAVY